tara:strand:+ start:573 stop:1082 length:510 start_codon:yes stop_codon:yes gene_type:complete
MDFAILPHIICLTMASPEFHLNKSKQDLVCKFANQIVDQSIENGIDPTLTVALIYIESGWDKDAVSHAGACGLSQVIPKYTGSKLTKTKRYTCEQLKNPKNSISAGIKTLRYWVHEYGKGRVRVGLCGYSSGFRCKGKGKLKRGYRYAKKVLKVKSKIDRAYKNRLKIP